MNTRCIPNDVLDGVPVCMSDLPPDELAQLNVLAAMERRAKTRWERRVWENRRRLVMRGIRRRLLEAAPERFDA